MLGANELKWCIDSALIYRLSLCVIYFVLKNCFVLVGATILQIKVWRVDQRTVWNHQICGYTIWKWKVWRARETAVWVEWRPYHITSHKISNMMTTFTQVRTRSTVDVVRLIVSVCCADWAESLLIYSVYPLIWYLNPTMNVCEITWKLFYAWY